MEEKEKKRRKKSAEEIGLYAVTVAVIVVVALNATGKMVWKRMTPKQLWRRLGTTGAQALLVAFVVVEEKKKTQMRKQRSGEESAVDLCFVSAQKRNVVVQLG